LQVRFADIYIAARTFQRRDPQRKQLEVLNARPSGFTSLLLKRVSFDAGSEVGRFFPIVCIGSDLPGRRSLFKCDSMFLDERNEFVRGRGMDVIGVLGRLIVDLPRAKCPLHPHFGAPFLLIASDIDTMRQSAASFTSAT
jgi:hypothetical protein